MADDAHEDRFRQHAAIMAGLARMIPTDEHGREASKRSAMTTARCERCWRT